MPQFFLRNAGDPTMVVNLPALGASLNVATFTGAAIQTWDIQVGPGALTPGLNINPVSALGNPVSPVGSNLVANPIPSPWNFVATVPAIAGQFRIQDPASGSFWGVASLTNGTLITLGPAGSPNQNWILELVG